MTRAALEELAERLERDLRRDSALREVGVRVKVASNGRDELVIWTRGAERYFACARTMREDVADFARICRAMIGREEKLQAALGPRPEPCLEV